MLALLSTTATVYTVALKRSLTPVETRQWWWYRRLGCTHAEVPRVSDRSDTFQGSFSGSKVTLERPRKKRCFSTGTFLQKMGLRFAGHRKNLLPQDGGLIFIYRTFDRKERKIEVVAIEWLQSRGDGRAVLGCIPYDEDTIFQHTSGMR